MKAAELYQGEGLDSDLALLSWFSAHQQLTPDGTAWLEKHRLPAPRPGPRRFSSWPTLSRPIIW